MRMRGRSLRPTAVAMLGFYLAAPAAAQLSGTSVSEDSGPLSEISTNVRSGSRPVHERGRSVRESSAGPLSGSTAGESSVAPVRSGTFSDISAGTVGSARSVRREKAESRLQPAPPRLGIGRPLPDPVYWEPVSNLDKLIEDLASIEPVAAPQDKEGIERQAASVQSASPGHSSPRPSARD